MTEYLETDQNLETTPEEAPVTAVEGTAEAPLEGQSEAQTLVSLEALIKKHLEQMENLKAEARKFSDMLADILINSGVYAEHEALAKEAVKTKNITKKDLLKDPSAQDLAKKVKSLKSEIKEHAGSLSYFLSEYQKMSGATTIEDLNGEVRDIVVAVKLVKKQTR